MKRRKTLELVSGDIIYLPGTATVLDAAHLMARKRIGSVLIIEEGKLRGIFTERDALVRVIAESREPGLTPLSGVMTSHPLTVGPDVVAVEALRIMRDGGYRHLPIVASGEVLGVISLRDFVGAELDEVEDQLEFETKIAEI